MLGAQKSAFSHTIVQCFSDGQLCFSLGILAYGCPVSRCAEAASSPTIVPEAQKDERMKVLRYLKTGISNQLIFFWIQDYP